MPVSQEVVLAGKFLEQSLVKYETQLIDTQYPEYWGYDGRYHNAIGDLPFGAKKIAMGRIDHTGQAVNYGGKATTIPLANFGINMDEYKTVTGVLAAEWDWTQLRAQEMAQTNTYLPYTNVVAEYTAALEKGLREWMHYKAVFGDSSLGMSGLINNAFVEVIDVNYATFLGLTDPNAIYDFFRVQASDFRKSSKLTVEATRVLSSEDVRVHMTRRFTDGSADGTPMQMLLRNNEMPSISAFDVVNEMSSDGLREGGLITGASSNDREWMLFYEASEDNMIRHFANIEYLPVRLLDDNMTYRLTGLCATSEVIYKRPYRARLYRFAKA
jgi:hypothetical protein